MIFALLILSASLLAAILSAARWPLANPAADDQPAQKEPPPAPTTQPGPTFFSDRLHLQRAKAASRKLGLPLPTLIFGLLWPLLTTPAASRAPTTDALLLTMATGSRLYTQLLTQRGTITEPILIVGTNHSWHHLRELSYDARQRYRVPQKSASLSHQ